MSFADPEDWHFRALADAYTTSLEPKLTQFRNLVAAVTELGCGHATDRGRY